MRYLNPFQMKTKNKIVFLFLTILVIALLALMIIWNRPKVVLHYAAWNLGTAEEPGMERKLIASFQKEHPDIKIVIEEAFVSNYDEAMKAATDKDTIPDVFMYSGNAKVAENDWCMDLTEIVKKDQDWEQIPKVLTDATYIKGKVIAIPSALYLYGYYYNRDVIEKSGFDPSKETMTLEEFVSYVKKSTNLKEGKIGLAEAGSICEWYPAALNPEMGWFSWDGGKLNLDSEEFKSAMALTRELNVEKYTFALLDESEKESLQSQGDWDAWNQGRVGFKFDGTWATSNNIKISKQIDFMGLPGGRTCIVPDFLFIAKGSKYPKEAYEFAKYMSVYSEEGFQARIEIAREFNLEISSLPMIQNQAVVDEYFSMIPMGGLKRAYQRFIAKPEDTFIEASKVIPGYQEARWMYKTRYQVSDQENATIGEVISACGLGKMEYGEIAEDMNYLANSSILIYPQQLTNEIGAETMTDTAPETTPETISDSFQMKIGDTVQKELWTQTEVFPENIDDTFVIDICLPDQLDENKKYPVVYLTDCYWRRGDYKAIKELYESGKSEEFILVGIGYPDDYDFDTIRERDLLRQPDEFLKMIMEGVLPYVEETYPIDVENRTFCGASFGGYFMIYSLLQSDGITKDMFKNYVLASPTFFESTDGKNLFEYEEEFSKRTDTLNVNIYMTVGGEESGSHFLVPIWKFVETLNERSYKGLQIEYEIYDGLDHYHVWVPSLLKGLEKFL